MDFTRSEYSVLMILAKNKCTSKMFAYTIEELVEKTNLSIPMIRKTVSIFRKLDLLADGIKEHQAKTYFITENGLKKIASLK